MVARSGCGDVKMKVHSVPHKAIWEVGLHLTLELSPMEEAAIHVELSMLLLGHRW